MRKYYQLLLLVICGLSVVILLMYKSENNRLKYVLQVVNFFGRKDSSILLRLENITRDEDYHDYAHPMPVWSTIGGNFYAYSAFWNRKELIAGGEAFAIVVGKNGAVVNYKCSVKFENGKAFKGSFKFQRMDLDTVDKTKDFTTYRFFCKLSRNFGSPNGVIFTDQSSKNSHEIKLRHINAVEKTGIKSNLEQITVCVDIVNFNLSTKYANNQNLLQFFLYHQANGVNSFQIYNGDTLSTHMRRLIYKAGFNVNYLPFNFPFNSLNASNEIRKILETDCNLRSVHHAQFTLLLNLNEFLFSRTKLNADDSILHSLQKHSSETLRFEVHCFSVCLGANVKILMDNKLFDPEAAASYKLYLYRPIASVLDSSTNGSQGSPNQKAQYSVLPLSNGLIHRYSECVHVGKDGLHDWRTNLREDFMQNILKLRNEISFLL